MRSSLLIPVAAALGLALFVPTFVSQASAEGKATRSDIIPVQALKKGMRGYGMTVFEGTVPERFEVEVIDILHNFRPRQEMILVKTEHPRLEVAKIVGGMSGSPIYFDGKMAGAYAYGWTFGVEPVAGVTPIRNMLDDLERPIPKLLHGFPIGVVDGRAPQRVAGGRYHGELTNYSVTNHAEQLADSMDSNAAYGRARGALGARRSELTPVTTPVLLGGMTSAATEMARELLSPLGLSPIQAGGSAGKKRVRKSEGYVDGGAIGVDLVSGDVSAMGLGTVTRVEGDHLVAFGHPMMGIGITSLPTTQARVLWFMASQMRSFKMGEGTYPTGSLVNDRQASIVVRQNLVAPTVQVSLSVEGEPGAPFNDWDFEVAHDRFLTPALLGVALGNALEATAAERRDVTWTMDSDIHFDGFDSIRIHDFGSTPSGTPAGPYLMQSVALKTIGQIFNNPFEYPRLLTVDVKVKLRFGREVTRLRGVQLLTPVVDPGGQARVRLHLQPFDGKPTTRVVSLEIPKHFAGQSVTVSVRPGHDIDRVRPAPENLAELISNLAAGTEEPRGLIFSYKTGQGSVAYRGVLAEDLPAGVMDRLGSEHSSRNPEQFPTMRHVTKKMPYYVIGADSFTVKVRDSAK